MADSLREALAWLAEQWSRYGRMDPLDPWTAHAADLRALLVAHPEPEPDPRACPDCGRPDHPEHWCGQRTRLPNETATACERALRAEDALARLYRDFAPTDPPAPEGAVRVRIAVAVDAEGEWDSAGASAYYQESVAAYDARREMGGDPSRLRLSWVEAWVPRPEAEQVVEGRVEEDGAE